MRRSVEATVRALKAREAIGSEHALLIGLMRHAAEMAEGPEGAGLSDSEKRQWCRLLTQLEATARGGVVPSDDGFNQFLAMVSGPGLVEHLVGSRPSAVLHAQPPNRPSSPATGTRPAVRGSPSRRSRPVRSRPVRDATTDISNPTVLATGTGPVSTRFIRRLVAKQLRGSWSRPTTWSKSRSPPATRTGSPTPR